MRLLLALCLFLPVQVWAHDSGDYPPNDQTSTGCAFSEYSYYGWVRNVVDGDTIDVDFSFGQDLWRKNQRLRFYDVISEQGVNAPETRTSNAAEKALGLAAKRWLVALIQHRWAVVTTYQDNTGSFGRLLATVCRDGHDLVRQMVDIGMVSVKNY